MEELASLIPIIIIAVISAIAKSSKNKAKQQHPYQQGMDAARPPQAQPAAPVQPRPATPAPARPAAPAAPAPKQVSMASMLPPVQQTMAPTVHTHLQPDCDTHDAPTIGSLNVVSPEGKDPCHDEQLPDRRAFALEAAPEQPGLQLDWSGNAMVRAFVMQEVLTRPCQRRR